MFKTKREIRTIFFVFILVFLAFSFIFLSDAILPYVTMGKFNYMSIIIKNQGIIFLSVIIAYFLSFYNYNFFDLKSGLSEFLTLLFITVIPLLNLFTLFFGASINGARRWLNVFGFYIQPSEFSKVAIVFFVILYYYFSKHKSTKKISLLLFFLALFMIGLVLLGKAVTTTLILLLLFNLLLLFTNTLTIKLFLAELILIIVGATSYIAFKGQYILNRLSHLFTSSKDIPLHVLNARNSYILGGLFGKGFYKGIMKYFYLPESYNDYIMAIIGEQVGFVGVMIFFLLLVIFSAFLIFISEKTNNISYNVILKSFGFIILIQTILHLFVTTSTISTGVILPFFSNGGSFSFVLCGYIIMASEAINNLNLEDR